MSTIAQAAAIASLLPTAEAELLERVDATVGRTIAGRQSRSAEDGLADSAVAGQLVWLPTAEAHRLRRAVAVRGGRGRCPPVRG